MIAAYLFILLASSRAGIQDDPRLDKHVSLHDEIISLSDLGNQLSRETGVPLMVKRRVADRKVTIVFKDRSAREAMDRLAACMRMSWQKQGSGYELDLTGQEAADEARTESLEREVARGAFRDATREILRLSNLDSKGRDAESLKIDREYRNALKSGESPDSPHMQLLSSEGSALHSWGFFEVVGPALASARLDDEGVPIGNLWLCSGDAADNVGHLDAPNFPVPPRAREIAYTDGIGIVEYDEDSHELQTKLLLKGLNDAGNMTTGEPGWAIPTSDSMKQSALDKAMKQWARPPSRELVTTHLDGPKSPALSEFCSGMLGRAQQLVDFADRSGIPVVADAFRRSLTKAQWLPGTTAKEWMDSYSKACKAPYKGQPDYVREENGWLMFREDHWWWRLKTEIPESILQPLELKSKDRSPLSFNEYAALVARLTPAQVKLLGRPETVLLRFPVGSLGSSYYSMVFYAGLDPAGREEALSHQGADLFSGSAQAQTLAYDSLLRMSVASSDMAFIRTVLRGGPTLLKNFRLFAEDELNQETDPAKIGNGRDINVSFTYMPTFRNAQSQESFRCSKGGP